MWKFQEFLNQNLAICLVMAVGAASVLRGGARLQRADARVFNIFLFKFLLPASVVMGLGIKTDVYGEWAGWAGAGGGSTAQHSTAQHSI